MKKSVLAFAAAVMLSAPQTVSAADWSYDFETAKNDIGTSFHDHLKVTLNGLSWDLYCVRNNGGTYDWANGSGSARIYGSKASADDMPYFTMAEDKPGGIGTVEFAYHEYAEHAYSQTSWVVQVSEDGGTRWTTVGQPFTPSDETQTFSAKVNKANARIRIVREDYATFEWKNQGFKGAFNIDDMRITDAVEVNPDQPVIYADVDVLKMGDTYKGEISSKPLVLTYNNLSEAMTLSISGSDCFTLSTTRVDLADGENTASVDVTFAPTSTGTHNATLTVTSGSASTVVMLTGNGVRKPGDYSFSGGSGAFEDPYIISTPGDIAELSEAVTAGYSYSGSYFRMTADIDMAGVKDMLPIGNNFGSNGSDVKAFSGTFDGEGHTVSNLIMKFTGQNKIGVALFGVIQNAHIKNLTLDDSYIQADALTAGIVSVAMGGTVSNCTVGENVQIDSRVQAYAGGVVCGAFEDPIVITDCVSRATVNAKGMGAAGILANCGSTNSVVERCVNFGKVASDNGIVGGIVGMMEDGSLTIRDCASIGRLESPETAGGILGLVSPACFGPLEISNCYSACEVDCYDKAHPITPAYEGSCCRLSNCYYSTDLFEDVDDAQGMTLAEMRTDGFATQLNNGRAEPWTRADNVADGYPMPLALEAETSNGSKLVASKISVPQYAYYRMFIQQYGEALDAYVSQLNRFAVQYVSDNEDVVKSAGNCFKSVAPGSAKVTMRISGAAGGSIDAFDENNVLDEIDFTVTVAADDVDPSMPRLNNDWGTDKPNAMAKQVAYGQRNMTDTYWKMHPKVSEEAREGVEIFSTGNFEFPLSFLYFNEDEELIASDLIVASWERVKTPVISYVCKNLKEQGFKDAGYDDGGNWQMYNPSTQTLANCGMVYVQNQAYYYTAFFYEPDAPELSVNNVKGENPDFELRTDGDNICINADTMAGETIVIYTVDGRCLHREAVKVGGNSINIATRQPIMVKVGKCSAVKVLR